MRGETCRGEGVGDARAGLTNALTICVLSGIGGPSNEPCRLLARFAIVGILAIEAGLLTPPIGLLAYFRHINALVTNSLRIVTGKLIGVTGNILAVTGNRTFGSGNVPAPCFPGP